MCRYRPLTRACSAGSRELRTLALHAGLVALDQALPMPGGLDALLEPVEKILEPSLEIPYPAGLYMKIEGEVAEQEFAVIGRHIYHESLLEEAGAPLGELAGLGLAAMQAICCEMFSIAPDIDGRPPVTVPMPAEFRKTFRDWAENKLSVTAPRLTPAPQTQH